MSGPDLIAGLVLAGSLFAPKLAPKSEWAGEVYLIRQSQTEYGRREADGSFTPSGEYLASIQYTVLAEDKDLAQVQNHGAKVWVRKADLVKLSEAPEYFTKMLDMQPESTIWFAFRAWAQFRNGRTAEALKDYGEAIRLNPDSPSWYGNRGLIYLETKKYDDAIADFNTSLELRETDTAYRNRAQAYVKKKEYVKAARDFRDAANLNPQSAINLNALAWHLCTAPDSNARDGRRAVEIALKACELTEYKNGGYVDTLAAAYAEAGDFAKAVEWQEKALKAGDIPIKDMAAAKKRLELFKAKKAYRDEE
ncbi:MAG TPA: tetratricopeptide repeat protein [Gemmataceae bacterium]|nr:tetratricopeptide repeat protein [Gemmataceae bacterium]